MGNASSNYYGDRLHFMTEMDLWDIIPNYPNHDEKMETHDHGEYLSIMSERSAKS